MVARISGESCNTSMPNERFCWRSMMLNVVCTKLDARRSARRRKGRDVHLANSASMTPCMSMPQASATYSGAAASITGISRSSMSFLTALMILCSVWLYWISERKGFIVFTLRALHSTQAQFFCLLDLLNNTFLVLIRFVSFQAAHNMRTTHHASVEQYDVCLGLDLARLSLFLMVGLREAVPLIVVVVRHVAQRTTHHYLV